jgi:sugar phosphate isomerase/epimerase
LEDLWENLGRLVGVEVNDWLEPTRGWCDRVLPDHGTIDLRTFLRTLDEAGYDGWHEIDLSSGSGPFGNGYLDSVRYRPPADVARERGAKFAHL